ncbi:MAG: hypothetical protein EBU46_01760 [Nitrosomonadaceae bacterium]|nr:hypothetical protein [Nitrosomonadaceae bacterium]
MNAPINKAEADAIAASWNSTDDTISVLFSDSGCPLAKTWQTNGNIKPYSNAKYFDLKEVRVKNIHELSHLLKHLEERSNACIIRGRYVGDKLDKERSNSEYKAGKVLRRSEVFEDQPLHAILIEVDEFEPEFSDLNSDPLNSIYEYIRLHLPSPFANASFYWQLSNTAGHLKNKGKLKVHLWFWLETPRTSAELKAWAKAVDLESDRAVFNPVQIHYTSTPIFEKDQVDPIPMRSGFEKGQQDVVVLDIDHRISIVHSKTNGEGSSELEQHDDNLDRTVTLDQVNGETIEDLESALMGMKQDRAEDYGKWIEVILALSSLKKTLYADRVLKLAHEFSQRSNKHNADDLDRRWNQMNSLHITYRSIFKWAQEDGWINPRSKQSQEHASRIDRTDAGNVALLAEIVDGNFRYVPGRGVWLHWDSEKWIADQYGVNAQECALKVADHYLLKAADIRKQSQDKSLAEMEIKRLEKTAESLEKWATQCRSKRTIDAMLSLAKSDANFVLSIENLDQNRYLFGVANGVVDLSTGNLREASRDEFVTRRSPVRFNPQANASRWLQFIEEITSTPDAKAEGGIRRRPALARYLQKALGYCLTGSTLEHKMFIAIGGGANGKSILLDITRWIMGDDYCKVISPEALMTTSFTMDAERPTSALAMLAGARLAISSENKDGQKLDVALVKRQTGGGSLSARFLRKDTFTFEITHKLWLMTNHRPSLDHMDDAVRGRLHLIPFDMQWNRPGHPEHNPDLPDGDKNLMDSLKEEAEGILAWVVEGAIAYQNEGLNPPQEVVQMTQTYFKENDPIGRWLDDCCEPCEPKQGMLASDLYSSFSVWFDDEDCFDACPSSTVFGGSLKQRGVQNQRTNKGMKYGLILHPEQKGDE